MSRKITNCPGVLPIPAWFRWRLEAILRREENDAAHFTQASSLDYITHHSKANLCIELLKLANLGEIKSDLKPRTPSRQSKL